MAGPVLLTAKFCRVADARNKAVHEHVNLERKICEER